MSIWMDWNLYNWGLCVGGARLAESHELWTTLYCQYSQTTDVTCIMTAGNGVQWGGIL